MENRPDPRSGPVLIMDDEEWVREVTGEMLRHLGYSVQFAAHGVEALRLLQEARERGEPFALVLLDLVIKGGMGGMETLREMLKADPFVRAISTSGYTDDPIMSDPGAHGFAASLSKPYRMEDLRQALESAFRKPEDLRCPSAD
jgi:two-component system, cell cycle sensor histidine kinase and response regulator CckA